MANRMNIRRLREEILKFTDVEKLRREADRLAKEFTKINLNRLTGPAQAQIERIEKKYAHFMKLLQSMQEQIDRELKNLALSFQQSRVDVQKRLKKVKHLAENQKNKVRKAINKRLKKSLNKKKRQVPAGKVSKKKKTSAKKSSSKRAGHGQS